MSAWIAGKGGAKALRLGGRQFDLERVRHTLGVNGCPVLEGAIAHLDCVTTKQYEGGDHTIFIGEVVDAKENTDGDPLAFYGGRYGNFTASA